MVRGGHNVTAGDAAPSGERVGHGGTPEAPAPAGAGKPGAPVAQHGHAGDDHGEEALGPIDWRSWGLSVLGLAFGGLIGVCLYLAAYPR